MKIRRFIEIILCLTVLASSFSSCSNNKHTETGGDILETPNETVLLQENTARIKAIDNFLAPDYIILYKNGTRRTINKKDKLYSDIVKYTNERIGETVGIAKQGFMKKDMNFVKQKEIGIEFLYSKKQHLKIDFIDKQYISLIFPLSGQYSDLCFFNDNTDIYHGPIGVLKQSSALLDLLKK